MNLKWMKPAAIGLAFGISLWTLATGNLVVRAADPEPATAKSDKADDKKADDKKAGDAKQDSKDEKKGDEITPEQLAKQVEFDWDSVSASAMHGLKQQFSQRSVNIGGQIKILNDEEIVGVSCQQTDLISAIDENGKDLVPPPPAQQQGLANWIMGGLRGGGNPNRPQRYYQFPSHQPPQAPWFGSVIPMGINVSVNLSQNAVPKKLTNVKASVMMLAGKPMPPVDMAASASEDWTELGKDLSIRLTKAEQNNGNIQYQLESKGDMAAKNFGGWVGPQQPLPKTVITKVAFVDEFNQIHEINSGSVFNPNSSGSAGFGDIGRIAIMRFTFVTDVHEVAVPFEIKDLDVPAFESDAKPTTN